MAATNPAPFLDDTFHRFQKLSVLAAEQIGALLDAGFLVIPGPFTPAQLMRVAETYDRAADSAASHGVRVGSSTTRINGFVDRDPEFEKLYTFGPVLEASCRVIGQPFHLSSLHGRTVRSQVPAQELHVDFAGDAKGWPMVGFILMLDEFREDNGATRFIPGSHRWTKDPAENNDTVLACGPAGSLIIYNGSVWHGYAANATAEPRRSLQGAFIRRDERPAMDWAAQILPETTTRIGPIAKYLLGI